MYVQSEGKEHQENILQEIDAPADVLHLRMTLLPSGYDEAVMTMEYFIEDKCCWIGTPFHPARHTWVGARLALFAMSLDGQEHGGSAEYSDFGVEGIETLE